VSHLGVLTLSVPLDRGLGYREGSQGIGSPVAARVPSCCHQRLAWAYLSHYCSGLPGVRYHGSRVHLTQVLGLRDLVEGLARLHVSAPDPDQLRWSLSEEHPLEARTFRGTAGSRALHCAEILASHQRHHHVAHLDYAEPGGIPESLVESLACVLPHLAKHS
jgi:hypothetical protein